jgi:hypothetical protein
MVSFLRETSRRQTIDLLVDIREKFDIFSNESGYQLYSRFDFWVGVLTY